MVYYIRERKADIELIRTAGIKARDDLDAIFEKEGMAALDIISSAKERKTLNLIQKTIEHIKVAILWKNNTAFLRKGDAVFIQFPAIEHSLFLYRIISKLKKRGVKTVLFVHDLEIFRHNKVENATLTIRLRKYFEETTILKYSDCIVVHNDSMRKKLTKEIGLKEDKLVSLEIFDYLVPGGKTENKPTHKKDAPIIISGNLSAGKAKYVYSLPNDIRFNLYGVNYQNNPRKNVEYCGSFSSEEIPFVMEGSFGLVWDGESAETCSGAFGDYLRINNPHKTSLYLASGIPVIIWDQAALAPMINQLKLGITVSSLYDIRRAIEKLSDEEYLEMKKNAEAFGKKLTDGYFSIRAINNSIEKLGMKR